MIKTMPVPFSRPIERTYTNDELDYEQKVNYKLRIFETIFPEKAQNAYDDNVIYKVLKDVDFIYEVLTKK